MKKQCTCCSTEGIQYNLQWKVSRQHSAVYYQDKYPKMSRLLLVITLCIASSILTECRMGWKNNNNEFFVYSANTSFNSTNSLTITGKFSIKPGTTSKSVLVAVDDVNGTLAFEVYIDDAGLLRNAVRQGSIIQAPAKSLPESRSGYVFDFTITVSQSLDNGTYSHSVRTGIAGVTALSTVVKDNINWNLDKMKLFVGGYSNPAAGISASYFDGCLSNVMFQGVDIIAIYFTQYPNNTNPVRGSIGSPPFATAMQDCGDVTSTVGPTSSTASAKITSTKKPGAAASYNASVFILVVAFLLTLFSF